MLLVSVVLISCESSEDKHSRMTIDAYTRKLNSMATDIVDSRKEEGNHTRLSVSQLFDRYIEKCDDFRDELVMEDISTKYDTTRLILEEISRAYQNYLNNRKPALIYWSVTPSSYRDYEEKKDIATEQLIEDLEWFTGDSKKLGVREKARQAQSRQRKADRLDALEESAEAEFKENQRNYLMYAPEVIRDIKTIKWISKEYNARLEGLKLEETISIPTNLLDTINDGVVADYENFKFFF